MQHNINRVILQGTVGPPHIRLSPVGPISASIEIQIAETPKVMVTVCGIGIDAAAIADTQSGAVLRVEGALTYDHEAQTFYVFADQVRRMVRRGADLVPVAPSMKTFDRLERVFLADPNPSRHDQALPQAQRAVEAIGERRKTEQKPGVGSLRSDARRAHRRY